MRTLSIELDLLRCSGMNDEQIAQVQAFHEEQLIQLQKKSEFQMASHVRIYASLYDALVGPPALQSHEEAQSALPYHERAVPALQHQDQAGSALPSHVQALCALPSHGQSSPESLGSTMASAPQNHDDGMQHMAYSLAQILYEGSRPAVLEQWDQYEAKSTGSDHHSFHDLKMTTPASSARSYKPRDQHFVDNGKGKKHKQEALVTFKPIHGQRGTEHFPDFDMKIAIMDIVTTVTVHDIGVQITTEGGWNARIEGVPPRGISFDPVPLSWNDLEHGKLSSITGGGVTITSGPKGAFLSFKTEEGHDVLFTMQLNGVHEGNIREIKLLRGRSDAEDDSCRMHSS